MGEESLFQYVKTLVATIQYVELKSQDKKKKRYYIFVNTPSPPISESFTPFNRPLSF